MVTTTFLVELPLEIDAIICTGIVGTCTVFGLSNLTPARSRLFQLIGKDGVMRWSCSSNKHIWWLTYANKSDKRSNAMVAKLEMIKK